MNRNVQMLFALVAVSGVAADIAPASAQVDGAASPIFGVKIPPGYRDWTLISIGHEEGNFNDLRAQFGNEIAIKAFREGTMPFPDGAIIAAVHWEYVSSAENNRVFGRQQSFIAGPVKNIQFMVKDSKKYASTGGWGFADFKDGKPSDEATHAACFSCHVPAISRDYVYTRYAP